MRVPVKTCKDCGEVYIIPYIPSPGVQFVLACFLGLFELIYWWNRGRGIRCPKCHSRNFDMILREIEPESNRKNYEEGAAGVFASVFFLGFLGLVIIRHRLAKVTA